MLILIIPPGPIPLVEDYDEIADWGKDYATWHRLVPRAYRTIEVAKAMTDLERSRREAQRRHPSHD